MTKSLPIQLLIIATFTVLSACSKKGKYSKEGYELVWNDEFEKDGLPDSTKWDYDTSGNEWGWGNNEWQYYTAKKIKNAEVKNGQLHIKALKESIGNKEYSSARLVSKNKGDWKYGIIEVKAIIPEGKGLWPAIWMMPTNSMYGIWPESGEIVIMENVGFKPDTILAAVHTKAYNHTIGTHQFSRVYIPECHKKFHVYRLVWEPEKIEVFVGDQKFFDFRNEKTGYKEWPFDQHFYLILNVAVGGNWGGKHGVDDRIFPRAMVLDYVRVYQKR